MKNYVSHFDVRNFRIIYIPREQDGEYAMLYLNVSRGLFKLITPKSLLATGVAGFVFLRPILFFILFIGILFGLLAFNKGIAKKLHLLIPIIVYAKMGEKEVRHFLQLNPQFSSEEKTQPVSKSRIIDDYVSEKTDTILSKITQPKSVSKKSNSSSTKTTFDSGSSNKSIFDDYESVIDKFNKK